MNKPFFTKETWTYAPKLNAVVIMRKHRIVPVASLGTANLVETDANGMLMAASKEMFDALYFYKENRGEYLDFAEFNSLLDIALNKATGNTT